MVSSGAPPALTTQYKGDHSTPFQYFDAMSGRSRRRRPLDVPFKALTITDTDSFVGHSINRWA
jgi:hypothetical protein